ncbi:MAG: GLPGLI family protein [Muribaculaceae bacterium]|nr:GLPGLI family protein [Muribaculaceae bacterium]
MTHRQSLIFTLLVLFAILTVSAKKKEYPHAQIKVGYNYHHKFHRGSDGVVESDISFILLANPSLSKFYCPGTEYKDSLFSTPAGRAAEKEMFAAAVKAYSEGRDRSAMESVTYKTSLYVVKNVMDSAMTVYDRGGLGEYGYYKEPIPCFDWEIVEEDSQKSILGYECLKAKVDDYHGRSWIVWFTPEIPLHDGPWKFCGLPGLILEASEPTGQHRFVATGIELSDKEILPIPDNPQKIYEKMDRKRMLTDYRNSLDNGMAIFKAQTGYNLGV